MIQKPLTYMVLGGPVLGGFYSIYIFIYIFTVYIYLYIIYLQYIYIYILYNEELVNQELFPVVDVTCAETCCRCDL